MAITDYPITSNWKEIDRVHPQPHSGIDFAVPLYNEIRSQDDAIVSVTHDNYLGDAVRLKLENGDIIVYGHLARVDVKNYQYIKKGDLLGLSGGIPNANQGISSGAHIHISQYHNGQLVNPYDYLFHHEQVENNNSSPFLLPVILIILFIILWKFKKYIFYGVAILLLLTIIFISS
jgi:murein DD-endopeptidase MepM/ murein hydrolase activator NlpD